MCKYYIIDTRLQQKTVSKHTENLKSELKHSEVCIVCQARYDKKGYHEFAWAMPAAAVIRHDLTVYFKLGRHPI